jgi:hypothetical protein
MKRLVCRLSELTSIAKGGGIMKRIGFLVLVFFGMTTTGLAADKGFEYYGVKSGMSKKEIREFLDLDSIARADKAKFSRSYENKSIDEMVDEQIKSKIFSERTKALSGKKVGLRFLFTDEGLLWRLDVYVNKPHDPAERIALDNAIKMRFKNYSIQEESSTNQYDGTIEFYRIVMTDDNVLSEAVKRYVIKFLAEM